MEWNRETAKSVLLTLCGVAAFYTALQRLDLVVGAVGWLLGILFPFLLGGAIAFILNVPMRAIEKRLMFRRDSKFRRPLALILTLAAVAGVLTLAVSVIGPGIGEAVSSITGQLPEAIRRGQELLQTLEGYLPQLQELLSSWELNWQSLSQKAIEVVRDWATALMSSGGGLMAGLVSGISSFVIGLIFSFYILLQKERLGRQCRKALYALLPERVADRFLDILTLTSQIFSSFLSGQCLEACILGTLFVVCMTLFRMPYALLVGVLIAMTALIPVIGAFIGCVVGALLIAVSDPWKALLFVALFLVLQQVEGNLIYPHVVGSSVGLPSIWVLAAVTLGGKLFGVVGMVFFIPLCSVFYALFRQFVHWQLSERRIPPEKWNPS